MQVLSPEISFFVKLWKEFVPQPKRYGPRMLLKPHPSTATLINAETPQGFVLGPTHDISHKDATLLINSMEHAIDHV